MSDQKPLGRPPILIDKALAISLAEKGMSIEQICEGLGVDTSTLYRNLDRDDLFSREYSRARQRGLELRADQLLTLPDTESDVNKARLKSDNIKWLLSKRLSGQYGDKIAIDLNAQMDIAGALLEARRRLRPMSDQPQQLEAQDVEYIEVNTPKSTVIQTVDSETPEPNIFD